MVEHPRCCSCCLLRHYYSTPGLLNQRKLYILTILGKTSGSGQNKSIIKKMPEFSWMLAALYSQELI
ncbi:hypothetical protein L1987_82919 [Smallanthus sonchifolius]|uniref:Uncharacterized protein n=1 Tax=Smallanthus sonchifolius TaxID=185202 RepID=A0ACB8YBV0_9ASTR|nr:hypothetical protein L1987_82919 [Smallanthus sonchifolius]